MLVLVGVFPVWPCSRGWAWRPTGTAAAILLLVVVLFSDRI
ncbi:MULTISPECIES: DUF3309 family protein [unclassified Mesorhizobium]|nr:MULTISPECIES: DUF3309 family protein [unclassified Mesorhizobium]PBB24630.1 DUF3309 domain-containing protein [Mesorhizobium sp. WSM4304]PBB73929.1 DUF3309 domain-containing protein [Mesorhizobium sp. WSM4308]